MNELTPVQKRARTKVARLQKQIEETQLKIKSLQDKCKHEVTNKTSGSNTGGYDGIDYYWTDYKCEICGHWWQGEEKKSDIWGNSYK